MKASLNLVLTHENISIKSSKRHNHREVHTIPKEMIPIIGETYIDAYGKEKIKPMELRQLDEYISQNFSDGYSIRTDPRYQEKIETYLKEHETLISTFSKNKKGSLVIVFSDENGWPRKMRVLYSNRSMKTNPKKVFKEIRTFLQNADDTTVCDIAEYYDFMFGLEYDRKDIYNRDIASPLAYYAKPIRQAIDCIRYNKNLPNGKNPHNTLVSWMCKRINDLLGSESKLDQDLGYYYVRLLDAHLAKKYEYETTPIKTLKEPKKTKIDSGKITTYGVPVKDVKLADTGIIGRIKKEDFNQLSFDDIQQPEPIVIPDDAMQRMETMEASSKPERYSPPVPNDNIIIDREDPDYGKDAAALYDEEHQDSNGTKLKEETESPKPKRYSPSLPDANIMFDRENSDYGKEAATLDDENHQDNNGTKLGTETMEEALKPEWYMPPFPKDNIIIDREDPDYGKDASTLDDEDDQDNNDIKQLRMD